MANIKSAIKRIDITERNRERNSAIRSQVKTQIRKLKDHIAAKKDNQEIPALLNQCYSVIDRAVSKGVYKKNSAARKKARLTIFINKVLEAQK